MDVPPRPFMRPPQWALAGLATMLLLDVLLPQARLLTPPFTYVGWLLIPAGILFSGFARKGFEEAGTTVRVYMPSTTLVTTGLHAISRNPMYVGMTVALAGVALVLGNVTGLGVTVVYVLLIQSRFIAVEERMLEARFGTAYQEYRNRVRRWL